MGESANRPAPTSGVAEVCPHCRTGINSGATICVGCGARKVERGFPNGSTGFFTFCFLWLAPAGFLIITPLKEYHSPPSYYDSTSAISGGATFGLICVGLALFVGGLIWIRKLIARAHDVLWVR